MAKEHAEAIEAARVQRERAVREAEQRERDRAAAETEAHETARLRTLADEARRAADVEHRRAVNRQILTAMEAFDVPAACAKLVISLIASGKIKRVSINY